MFSTPNLTTKGKERLLINGFVTQHDLLCNCNQPAVHCLHILIRQLKPELSTEDKNQLIKCLGTEDTTDAVTANDGLGLEDLEKLFAEDPTTDDTG